MSIYAIGDLHLSFNNPKPMNIFGENWNDHEEKIKENWLKTVSKEDTVIHLGDFSWAMNLEDTVKDFEYLNNLPGRKIMMKGNHEYWWTTITNMKKFLEEHNFKNIDFLQNNSFEIEDKIICGTRGWSLNTMETENSKKIIAREAIRLELSIQDALKKNMDIKENLQNNIIDENYKKDAVKKINKEIIVFMHYPPITNQNIKTEFMKILKKYEIKRCYYAHLHGNSIQEKVEGNVEGIEFKLASSDSMNFKLLKIR